MVGRFLWSEKLLLGKVGFQTCFGRFSPGGMVFRTTPSEENYLVVPRGSSSTFPFPRPWVFLDDLEK